MSHTHTFTLFATTLAVTHLSSDLIDTSIRDHFHEKVAGYPLCTYHFTALDYGHEDDPSFPPIL
jgi:hypothetical protein